MSASTAMDGIGSRRGARAAGFGLVELMVALAIGAFVMSGSIAIYLEARKARASLDTSARLQEIARYAMAVIEPDVRMAGYWGLTNRAGSVTAHPSLAFPAKCGGTAWITATRRYVDGSNNAYLAAANCTALYGGAEPGADVLVVRRASAQRIAPQRPVIAATDRDRVLVVTSHSGGEIFLPMSIGNGIPAGYATTDVAGETPRADTRALLVNAYYVSAGSSMSRDHPALRRKTLAAGPDIADEEVIAGIEDLQFQLGLDTDGDSDADRFVNPGSVPDGALPVSVRVWLRVRAEARDASVGSQELPSYADRPASVATDAHLRLLVSKTLQIRNARP
jgi:prepilin-type N-terminal cleavage/methylation domain-containing protein